MGNSKSVSFLQSREGLKCYISLHYPLTYKYIWNNPSLSSAYQEGIKKLGQYILYLYIFELMEHTNEFTLCQYTVSVIPCFCDTYYLMTFWKYSVIRNFSPTSCLSTDILLLELINACHFLLSWRGISVLHPGTLHFKNVCIIKSNFLALMTL